MHSRGGAITIANVAGEDDQPNGETLDFIFNIIKGAPPEHHQVWTALDGKATSVFGVGSAVVGLSGFSVATAKSTSLAVAVLLSVALLAYATAAINAMLQLWPARASNATYGDTLWPDAWNQPVSEIKHGLVQDITKGSKENKEALRNKAKRLRWVVAAVALETFFIGVAFIVRLVAG